MLLQYMQSVLPWPLGGCSEMTSTKRGEGGVCQKMMDDDDGLKGKWNTIRYFSNINFEI